MTRSFSPLKCKQRIDHLIKTGEEFVLVDEAKRLNIRSKQFLALVKKRDETAKRIPQKFKNCVMAGNYVKYQFVKEIPNER